MDVLVSQVFNKKPLPETGERLFYKVFIISRFYSTADRAILFVINHTDKPDSATAFTSK